MLSKVSGGADPHGRVRQNENVTRSMLTRVTSSGVISVFADGRKIVRSPATQSSLSTSNVCTIAAPATVCAKRERKSRLFIATFTVRMVQSSPQRPCDVIANLLLLPKDGEHPLLTDGALNGFRSSIRTLFAVGKKCATDAARLDSYERARQLRFSVGAARLRAHRPYPMCT